MANMFPKLMGRQALPQVGWIFHANSCFLSEGGFVRPALDAVSLPCLLTIFLLIVADFEAGCKGTPPDVSRRSAK